MIGTTIVRGGKVRDEAEKPFWISYADLMTALMVLFLVVMSVALLAVTKTVDEAAQQAKERSDAIEGLLNDLEKVVATDPEIRVNKDRHSIEFGDRARFADNRAELSEEKQRKLREFVPGVLQVASTDKGAPLAEARRSRRLYVPNRRLPVQPQSQPAKKPTISLFVFRASDAG